MTLNPLSLLSSAGSAISGFLGGFQTYLIAGGLALAVGAAGGAWAGYRLEASKVAAIRLADAQSEAQALQAANRSLQRQDAVTLAAALAEAKAQEKVVTVTQTLTREVPRYVTVHEDAVVCVPYGLVRLLDASALQADPAGLGLPAGQSDAACSPIKASVLAGTVIENYGLFHSVAEQLTALQSWVVDNQKAQAQP